MTVDVDHAIAEYAATHHGAFATWRPPGSLMTPRQRQQRVDSHRWIRLHDGVYAIAGSTATWRQRLTAGCFAAGPLALASHRSAAAVLDLPGGRTDMIEITCPRAMRGKEHGIVVHEIKEIDPLDVREHDGVPITSPELTLLQLGAIFGPGLVESAYDVARRRKLVTERSVRELLARLGARGRNGVGVLRAVVDERARLGGVPESVMESRVLRILRSAGLPDPVPQYEITHEGRFVARVDFAYPDDRIAVEYDSTSFHLDDQARVRDTRRRRALERSRWRVVEVTHDDVKSGCVDVVRTIRSLLGGPV